ncbi:UNVERIFIED_CONTAM: hypothetical protein K2H54_042699 [Gekko kuhli]
MDPMALLIVSCQIFQLQASLQAPQLTAKPRSLYYMTGQPVTLTCLLSGHGKAKKFTFFKDKAELNSVEHSESYHISQLQIYNSGSYSCNHCTMSDMGPIHCLESSSVWITVLDPPPRPVLKLDPPTGEVNEGNRLLITCSTNRNSTEKRFHFYRDGVEMNPANEGLLWHSREAGGASTDASVTILQARPSQTGGFACSYEEKNSSHWISSPWSQKVNITVLAQFPKISLGFAALAIPLPVLMVLLIVYCMRKKKASKRQQEFELTENKEEIDLDYFETLTPQAATLQQQEGSEVTYADVRISSAGTPLKPMMRNKLKQVEEEKVLYSRVRFQPTSRATK